VADIAAWYQHLALPDPQRLVFEYEGRLWSPTTIPTGASYCPLLAHTIASAIAAVAVRRSRIAGSDVNIMCHEVYIDNFRFLGSFDDLLILRSNLVAACSEVSVLLNDIDDIQPSTEYVFLGIRYSHNHAVSVGPKLEKKLQEFRSGLLHNRQYTLRELLTLFGACIWVTMAFRLPMYQYYYAFKFLRRKVDKPLDDPINLWSVLPRILVGWIDDCLCSQAWPTADSRPDPSLIPLRAGGPNSGVLVTDACLSGWGALLFCAGRVRVVAESWPSSVLARSLDINVLEMLAVRFAHARLLQDGPRGPPRFVAPAPQLHTAEVHLVVDNTTVLNVFAKQRSRVWLLNAIAGDLPGVWASVSYVPSALNPADWLSRYSKTHGRSFSGTLADGKFLVSSLSGHPSDASQALPRDITTVPFNGRSNLAVGSRGGGGELTSPSSQV